MITILRSLARQVRTVFRRALHGAGRGRSLLPLQLIAGPTGLLIRVQLDGVAIEYRDPTARETDQIVVPFQLLEDCEGRRDDTVQIETTADGTVTARWHDRNVPQIVVHPLLEMAEDFPAWPDDAMENGPELLQALHHAMQTADAEAVRYATNCVQLRGQSGSLAATDGRQLLVQTGFQFPWQDALLIPRTNVFGCKELQGGQKVLVGKSDKWISIRVGPWTIHLTINQEGRFPEVEKHIGKVRDATANVRFSESDMAFLQQSLGSLPSSESANAAVTLDLNGRVAVRAQSEENAQPIELVLTGSAASGTAVRINTNRSYLERALKLGFRQLHVFQPEAPVLCQDERRSYVWAPLSAAEALAATSDAVCIESPAEVRVPRKSESNNERSTLPVRKATKPIQQETDGNNSLVVNDSNDGDVITQAEQLRASLRDSLAKTNELLGSLKRHKKQARLVKATLDSLRRLPGVAS